MKKGLLFTLVVMFLGIGSLMAQWDQMAEQDLIDGSFKFSSGIDLAHFKGVTVIGTEIDGNNQLYYSKDIGKKWSKMKMPTTTNNSKSGYFNQLVFNELGIFFVDKYNSVNAEVGVEIYNTKDLGQTWQKFTVKFPALAVSDFFELTSVDSNVYLLHLPNYGNYGVTYVYKFDIKNNNWALFDDLYSDNKSEYGQFYNVSKNRIVYSKNSIVGNLNKVYILNSSNKAELLKFNSKSPNEDYPNLRLKSANCIAEDSTIVYVYRKTEQDKTFYVEVSINLGKTWQTSTIGNFDRFPSISPIFRPFFYPRIQIDKNKIYITGSHSTFISEDFGVNWKSITVNLNPDNNAQIDIGNRIDKFIVSDSLHFTFKNQRLFTKNVKDTNWNYANNVSSNFLGLGKINDSLISASVFNAYLESSNQGKIWKAFPFDTSVSVRIKTDKFLLGTRGGITFRSFDSAKTWSVDSIFPKYLVDVVVSGDTIVLMSEDSTSSRKEILYFTGLPYNKPNLLRKIYSVGTGSILYLNGIVYYATNDSLGRKTLGIKRLKIDGTALSDVFTDERLIPGTLMNSNNKVYALIANQYGYSVKGLGFSDDFGITWKKYAMPTGVGTYVKIDKFLFGSTFVPKQCGSLNQSDGGIYVSADDGKSWYRYNDGINTNCNSFQANFTQIDSFIFAYSSFGLWRTKLSNFNLKSLSGTVFIDKNKNGIKDTDEKGFPNAKVFLSNAGAFTTTDSLGNYAFLADLKATDTLKASIDSKYATYTPPYLLVSQSDTVKNIGVFIPANLQDLVVNGTAITPPRSGFTNSYLLTYKNAGAITKSGKVTFTYNAKQTYVEATQAPTSNANNALSWDYANLQPNESRTLKVTFKTAADVPIRTQLTNVATIEPIATDTFKTDNVDSLFQIVVGSYDPNDKQVSFLNTRQVPSVIDPNTEMTYTIRFQNTGNYQADFVRVTDTLSDKLDLTTLRVLATSHNYTLSVKNKNVLQFEFNPIYLPDSMTSEANSHGFIKFAIKPKKTLTKDEMIKNTAYIFFDYNPAIITNTVETANQKVNGLFTPSVLESLSVFPNPTNGEISFSLDKYQGKAISINVYSIDGKLMMNKHAVGEAVNRINGESLRNGLYVLQVRVGDDIVFGKFMVQK
jgi:uncharacterized repeat protein (TIGR01451 family)